MALFMVNENSTKYRKVNLYSFSIAAQARGYKLNIKGVFNILRELKYPRQFKTPKYFTSLLQRCMI